MKPQASPVPPPGTTARGKSLQGGASLSLIWGLGAFVLTPLACIGNSATSAAAPGNAEQQTAPRSPIQLERVTYVSERLRSGQLNLLTYNVAGLPQWLSQSAPAHNLPLASPLFRTYDLVLAQEDWAYHHLLTQQVEHPFIALPSERTSALLGDGLSIFSHYPMGETRHIPWAHCNGYLTALSDCLADKGFSVTTIRLSPMAGLTLINLHADAGVADQDVQARKSEFSQLGQFVQQELQGQALIVAGDTNLEPLAQRDRQTSKLFAHTTGLSDACTVLSCRSGGIDRVLYRSSDNLHLTALSHSLDSRFVDADGQPLSDHPALAVTLRWELRTPPRTVALQPQPYP